jgi:hypothetical protein
MPERREILEEVSPKWYMPKDASSLASQATDEG